MTDLLTPDEVFKALIALAKRPPQRRDGCKPRGRRLTIGEIAAMRRGRERAARRRRIEVRARAWARISSTRRRSGSYGARMRDWLLLAMLPGCWHSRNGIVAAAGLPRNANGIVNQVLLPAGLIERVPDADWTPQPYFGRHDRPWLYRLTWRGEREREAMLLLQ